MFDHLANVIEAALAVVGENHGIGAFDLLVERTENGCQNFSRWRVFKVGAQHLLLARNDAQLDGRFDRRIGLKQ